MAHPNNNPLDKFATNNNIPEETFSLVSIQVSLNDNPLPKHNPLLKTVPIIIAYFPLNYILRFWLPNYEESLMYLGILLPLAIFTAKVMLLTNNYLKVYRKEKIMLIINIITLGVCFLACLASAYLFNSLDILIYSLLFVCMMRSIVSEIVVMRIIKQNAWCDFAIELIMSVIFVVAARYFSLWMGCLIYAVALIGYCIIYRKNLAGIFKNFKNRNHKEKAE